MTSRSLSESLTSSPSSTPTRSNFLVNNRPENIRAKCLVEIPLVPLPTINTTHMTELDSAKFVNIVFENDENDAYFRISNESNKEVCRIVSYRNEQTERQLERKGVKYLECRDLLGNCLLYVAYPVGLGEVAILTPSEELIGECQSNVEFICLSVKVKYNFYDPNGNRLLKMTGIMAEEGSADKFMLMVKRTKNEKLALVKMGSLNSCCHIKFKQGEVSIMERLLIIALWSGFMHNELLDTNAPELLEKHAENKRERKSQHNKTIITKVVDNVFKDNREFSDVPFSHQGQSSSNNNIDRDCGHANDNIGEKTNANLNGTPVNKIKIWKDLVTSHFSRRNHHHHQDQNTDSESNNNINDDDEHANAGSKDTRKLNRSKEDSDSASTSYKIKKNHNAV